MTNFQFWLFSKKRHSLFGHLLITNVSFWLFINNQTAMWFFTYYHTCFGYVVNKPLSAADISKDNAQGSKIVRKMNSWPKSEASRATVKF